uniref:Uncharacterized protein n=1 Tax=Anguilla anguilla TaxID=7936 RepID=A0A0E9UWQ9_ANGAN
MAVSSCKFECCRQLKSLRLTMVRCK